MQALIELIAKFIAVLATVVLAHFGVDLQAPRAIERDVQRISDCRPTAVPDDGAKSAASRC